MNAPTMPFSIIINNLLCTLFSSFLYSLLCCMLYPPCQSVFFRLGELLYTAMELAPELKNKIRIKANYYCLNTVKYLHTFSKCAYNGKRQHVFHQNNNNAMRSLLFQPVAIHLQVVVTPVKPIGILQLQLCTAEINSRSIFDTQMKQISLLNCVLLR